MFVFDFLCSNPQCKEITEEAVHKGVEEIECPHCGSPAMRQFSIIRSYTSICFDWTFNECLISDIEPPDLQRKWV